MHRCASVLAVLLAPVGLMNAAAAERSATWFAVAQPAVSVLAANEARAARHARETDGAAAAPAPIPPLPERKDPKAASAALPEPEVWSAQEIAAAQASCAKLLKSVDATYLPHPPIREGKCGTPAPIRLMSLGKKQPVSFSPPALVNCDMAAALHKWITEDVQRLAKRHLGERIAKIEVMSDYSCRASFGRKGNRLSEHAFADALDIRGFVTESGKTAHVLEAWGTTKREIALQIAAAKAEAEREAALRAAADKTAQDNLKDAKTAAADTAAVTPTAVASNLGTPGAGLTKRTRSADGAQRITVTLPGAPVRKPLEIASRLGGPPAMQRKDDPPAKVAALSPQSLAAPATGPRAEFLHAAHAAACRIFGTTLGPEANEAHRNHFHVDMAERTFKKICD